MNKNFKRKILSLLAIISVTCALLCVSALGAPMVKVSFKLSKNEVDYARNSKNQPIQYIAVVVPNVQDLDCYTVQYYRTSKGDGTVLKTPDAPIAAPSQSGVYKAIITFNEDCEHFCDNGQKSKEYPSALTIRRIHQDTPQLKSRSEALVQNGDGKSGNIVVGGQGVISTFWTSGIKPEYSWSAGSNKIVQLEDGKPARFTALAAGEATLSVMLPEDNNHFPSEVVSFKVTVFGESEAAGGYTLQGEKKNESGWYTGDVEIIGQKGFDSLVVTGANPVNEDGTTLVSVAHKAQDGTLSSPQSVTIKRDATPATMAITVNDSPYTDAPFSESAWAKATNFVVKADISDETSGLGRVEYKVDGGEYVTDAGAVFSTEGTQTFVYTHTFASGGAHTLYLRVQDFAGNVTEQKISLGEKLDNAAPIKAENNENNVTPPAPSSSSELLPPVTALKTEYEVPTQATAAMDEVAARLKYLIRCDIDAIVAGDVRANADYLEQTYNMFKELTPGERKGLGEETLAELKKYFTAVLMQAGLDPQEVDKYYDFTIPPSEEIPAPIASSALPDSSAAASVPASAPALTSEELAKEQKIPQAPSETQGKASDNEIPVIYLVPLAVFLSAIVGYFVWKRHSLASKNEPFSGEDLSAKPEFSDLDQIDKHNDDDNY